MWAQPFLFSSCPLFHEKRAWFFYQVRPASDLLQTIVNFRKPKNIIVALAISMILNTKVIT